MPFPPLDKTWQFNVNQALPAQGSATACDKLILFTLVQSMTSFALNPWQVRGSSNASTSSLLALNAPGPGTGWSGVGSLTWASSGSPHSWIVLRNTALGSGNPEIMIGCDPNGGGSASVNLWLSPSAGFTGGSTTTNPTATDQLQLSQGGVNRIGTGSTNLNTAYAVHAMMSSDGQCTRLMVFSGGTFENLWLIDAVKNPVTGWTSPWVFHTEYLSPSINGTWHNTSQTYGGHLNSTLRFYWTAEGCTGTGALIPQLYNAPNDLSGEYPMLPIGLFVWPPLGPYFGRHGKFYDLWYGCAALATGQLYAGAIAHNYVQVGEFILPWSGAAAMNTS